MQKLTGKQSILTKVPGAGERLTLRSGAQPTSSLPDAVLNTVRAARWVAVLGLLLALLAPSQFCFATTSLLTPENRKDLELQPGVVLIFVQFKATLGQWVVTPTITGSGFLYRPDGYLITNGHVAQLADDKDNKADLSRNKEAALEIRDAIVKAQREKLGRELTDEEKQGILLDVVKLIDQHALQIEDMTLTVFLSNGDHYKGEIKAYSDPITEDGKDVAIIKIDGKNLPTVVLGNSDDVSVGDPLTVIGYPGAATSASMSGAFSERSALIPTVTSGRISAVNKTDYKGTPVLQSEASILPGNSGGPAFDANGRVVGIATYSLHNANGLNFFVPINTAMEFVRQAGAEPQRGAFDQMWHSALDAYAGQHWYKAHELMGSVLEMLPNQPDATKLQLQAAQNSSALGPVAYWVDRLGAGAVATAGAVLVLIVVVVIILLIRKPATRIDGSQAHWQSSSAASMAANGPALSGTETAKAALPAVENFGTLHINNGPLKGNRFQIPQKGLLIGRDPSLCSVVLPDDTVSKEHAWVVPLDNAVAVIDRSSANGTYVNSTDSPRISKMTLKTGDRIFIGRKSPTEITYFSS